MTNTNTNTDISFNNPNKLSICVCGGGDIGKSLINVLSKSDLFLTNWYSSKSLNTEFEIIFKNKKSIVSNYTIITDLEKHKFDVMIFTYPHMYYKEKYEEIFTKNPSITKCVYFMFAFGSAIEIIYDFIHKYYYTNNIGVIIGNRAFFHAKPINGTTNISKFCDSKCHCFDNNINCLKVISYLNTINFNIKVTNNPFEIFINYSNMILHPSLWIDKYISNLNTFENDDYIYRNVKFEFVNVYKNIYLEMIYLQKKLSGHENSNINKFFYSKISSNWLFDVITTLFFELTMPKNYYGNKEVKYKHYSRDVINGLYYLYKVSKIYGCKIKYTKKICDIFKKNIYFKDCKTKVICNRYSVQYFYKYYQKILNSSSYLKLENNILSSFSNCNIPIFFVRHAEGQHQVVNKFSAFINNMTDPLLSLNGINSIFDNNKILIDENTLLISSSLLRCIMTAKLLCSNKNITLHINEYFRERSLFIYPEDRMTNEYSIPFFLYNNIDIRVVYKIINYYKGNKKYNKCVIVTHRNFISKITNIEEEKIKNICWIKYNPLSITN